MKKQEDSNQIIKDIEIVIKRSKRKTACIRILPDGVVEVRGPKNMSDTFVRNFITEKQAWILEKRREVLVYESKKPVHTYCTGDKFLYLGQEYSLSIQAAGRKRIELSEQKLIVYTTCFEPKAVEKQIKDWYKKKSLEYISKRVELLNAEDCFGQIKEIVIEDRKTRWGSCSNRGELTFSRKLIMAPEQVIDYVLIHELCHLHHMDHSPAFWKAVAAAMPEYKHSMEWLKENGMCLL